MHCLAPRCSTMLTLLGAHLLMSGISLARQITARDSGRIELLLCRFAQQASFSEAAAVERRKCRSASMACLGLLQTLISAAALYTGLNAEACWSTLLCRTNEGHGVQASSELWMFHTKCDPPVSLACLMWGQSSRSAVLMQVSTSHRLKPGLPLSFRLCLATAAAPA